MSLQRLPKILGYVKSKKLDKGVSLCNNFRNLNQVKEIYGSQEKWMASVVEDMQDTANRFNTNITLSTGFLKRMEETKFTSDKIQGGRYIKPDYSEFEGTIPEDKDISDCLPQMLEILIVDTNN